LRILSNIVVLLAFLLRYAGLVIVDVIFSIFNFLWQSHSEITLLLSTCASLYCSHATQIREDLHELE